MKGLLIKDLMLMKIQKKFLIIIPLIAVLLVFSSNNISFIVSYITFIMPFFALSTISYDEIDNGYSFLFTMPISRRLYVLEKYVFTGLMALSAALLSTLLVLGIGAFLGNMEEAIRAALSSPLILGVVLLIMSVMLPLQLKLGAEKARIAMFAVGAGFAILVLGLAKLLPMLGVELSDVMGAVERTSPYLIVFGWFALIIIAVLISVGVSMDIMKKKEF